MEKAIRLQGANDGLLSLMKDDPSIKITQVTVNPSHLCCHLLLFTYTMNVIAKCLWYIINHCSVRVMAKANTLLFVPEKNSVVVIFTLKHPRERQLLFTIQHHNLVMYNAFRMKAIKSRQH